MTRSLNDQIVPALGWALYLGASWTWCIGMFLPALLVRDYAWPGFWVFAVPNIAGAAAMGWVLRQGVSEQIVSRHAGACAAFSVVTILFHVCFAAWMLRLLLGEWAVLAVLALIGAFWILGRAMRTGDRLMALFVYAVSVVAFVRIVDTARFLPPTMPAIEEVPMTGLAGLGLVCLFGFLLCPYLDLTFHRARQENDARRSRLAFSLGFGVFFLAMILFTLVYAGTLQPTLWPRLVRQRSPGLKLAQALVGLHMAGQLAFTVVIHLRELTRLSVPSPRRAALLVLLLLIAPAAGLGVLAERGGYWLGLDRGELIYRFFMAFYGLVFPAYVWLCMTPIARGEPGANRRNLSIFAAALMIAAPMYWLAFIGGKMVAVIPAVLIVAAARSLVRNNEPATAILK